MGTILEIAGVSKSFGGLQAVKNLDFVVEDGQIFGIAGPNGAGKTTLFDTISGHSRATAGKIRFLGREIQHLPPQDICTLGLVRTFQTPVAFGGETVLANVLVGSTFGHPHRRGFALRFSSEAVDDALAALEFVGLASRQAVRADRLSVFEKKRLMMATALASHPRLLLLDEPHGGLNRAEREEMMDLIRRTNRAGITVIMIEHVMKALLALSDHLLILHHGEKLAEGVPQEVIRMEQVVRVYLGDQVGQFLLVTEGSGQ